MSVKLYPYYSGKNTDWGYLRMVLRRYLDLQGRKSDNYLMLCWHQLHVRVPLMKPLFWWITCSFDDTVNCILDKPAKWDMSTLTQFKTLILHMERNWLFCHSRQRLRWKKASCQLKDTWVERLLSVICSFKTVQEWKSTVCIEHAFATCSLYLESWSQIWMFAVKFFIGYFTFYHNICYYYT
jgi:hypothetical protein